MKTALLIGSLFFVPALFSQDYKPFPDSGAAWVVHEFFNDGGGPPDWPYDQYLSVISNYCVNGEDTLISANTYTKINICNGPYHGAIRDNGGQVFFVPKDSVNEFLLFDFTVQEGDTIPVSSFYHLMWNTDIVVDQVDSVLVNGYYRTVVWVAGWGDAWTEGIGSSIGLFLPPQYNNNVSGAWAGTACFSHNDTLYNTSGSPMINGFGTCELNYVGQPETLKPTAVSVFPNPTGGPVTITIPNLSSDAVITIADASGRQIYPPVLRSGYTVQIDLADYATGFYVIRIMQDERFETLKIIRR
jgi:hypothetical protein